MTGYTVHTGATEKFVEGWDHIFKKTSAKGASTERTGRRRANAAARVNSGLLRALRRTASDPTRYGYR